MKRVKFFYCSILVASVIGIAIPVNVKAQKDFPHDTSYYETFPHTITVRLFLSRKYVHLNFPAMGGASELEYKANAKVNLGAGITLHNFSLNIFYGFGFLNNSTKEKGKTKGLDLQLHIYPHKWAIDVLAVFPKGFYLDPKGYASNNPNTYYYRPDIKQTLFGLSAYRVPNKEKFSYRAAILQTEWQKRSAGSVLFGGQVYYGDVKGDSAIVPKRIQNSFAQAGLTEISFVNIGPGIGYAYTLVMAKHFFITGSLIGNLGINFNTEKGSSKNTKVSISPAEVFKTAIGYNSRTWSVAANWTGNGIWFKGASSSKDYFWPTGQIRFVVSKKF